MISNGGALLYAKDLRHFPKLARKAARVVHYKGTSRIETIKEQVGQRGYASGFQGLIGYIADQLPHSEVIQDGIRMDNLQFPRLAIRELGANALIHQDLTITGAGPLIEIFDDRLEITNPGSRCWTPSVSSTSRQDRGMSSSVRRCEGSAWQRTWEWLGQDRFRDRVSPTSASAGGSEGRADVRHSVRSEATGGHGQARTSPGDVPARLPAVRQQPEHQQCEHPCTFRHPRSQQGPGLEDHQGCRRGRDDRGARPDSRTSGVEVRAVLGGPGAMIVDENLHTRSTTRPKLPLTCKDATPWLLIGYWDPASSRSSADSSPTCALGEGGISRNGISKRA